MERKQRKDKMQKAAHILLYLTETEKASLNELTRALNEEVSKRRLQDHLNYLMDEGLIETNRKRKNKHNTKRLVYGLHGDLTNAGRIIRFIYDSIGDDEKKIKMRNLISSQWYEQVVTWALAAVALVKWPENEDSWMDFERLSRAHYGIFPNVRLANKPQKEETTDVICDIIANTKQVEHALRVLLVISPSAAMAFFNSYKDVPELFFSGTKESRQLIVETLGKMIRAFDPVDVVIPFSLLTGILMVNQNDYSLLVSRWEKRYRCT